MKKLTLILSLITYIVLSAEEPANTTIKQSSEDYRTKKAYEAIIYDTYQEAIPINRSHWTDACKKIVEQAGLALDDVNFYTAVRMNRFIEKVGNNIIILRPNFFLYLTEEEQAACMAVQLSRIKAGDVSEVNHIAEKKLSQLDTIAQTAIGSALAFHYRDALYDAAVASMPYLQTGLEHAQDLLLSKTGAVIGACVIASISAHIMHTRAELASLTEHELTVIDKIGPDGLVNLRERQVGWGKNNFSWLRYQWYVLLGTLGLTENPQTQLQQYHEHLNKKNAHETSRPL